MKPFVSRTPLVGVLLVTGAITTACASSQKQMTEPQQAAARAEDQAQKAQEEAQKARDEANKAQKDLAEAQQDSSDARRAEVAADQKAQQASHQAGLAEQRAGQAARPVPVVVVTPATASTGASGTSGKGVTEAQGAQAGHDSAGKVVVITASLLFPTGSAELLPSSKPKLDEIAGALQAQPQASHVKVQGYTDSTGPSEINDPLSQQRAQAVADYLESKGVSPDRISAQGFGKQDPVSHAQTTEGRALNRRVDIAIEPVQGGKTPAPQPAPTQP